MSVRYAQVALSCDYENCDTRLLTSFEQPLMDSYPRDYLRFANPEGWAVGRLVEVDGLGRVTRKDFCPSHAKMGEER